MTDPVLGLLGVGLLGSALAERFLQAGFALHGYDPNPLRRQILIELGGQACKSARVVAQASRLLVLSLPTSDVVEQVLEEIAADLQPGYIILDTTTGDPDRTAYTGQMLAERGIAYLDATIAGSSALVRSGEVVAMIGGHPDALLACRDVLTAMTPTYFHVGPCGAGARMKLVVNLVLGLQRAVLAEGLVFAERCGIERNEALQVLRAGPTYARVMDTKGPKMIEGDFIPQARLGQHLKDVHLILEQAGRVGANVPLSELHRALLEKAVELGFGQMDNAAIVQAFE
jgi:3-hydroxyisobutyrate dehydrogenase-like beta-hydroxyacid dehydrogenase